MKITHLGRKDIVTIFLGFLILTSLVAWVSANPPKTDQFASVSVLGSTMTATNYFPNNNVTVTPNERISWTVQVYNHLSNTQLFLLEVRLANTTTVGPNATRNIPSQGPVLFQSYLALLNNETWNLPLQWSITGETSSGGANPTTTIQSVLFNNTPVNGISVSAIKGNNFRIVIELWSYDTQAHGFVFSFNANNALSSVFNQIWFNAG